MPAWRAWSIRVSSRKCARSPPSLPMTAESASSHSRVSCESASLAAAPRDRFATLGLLVSVMLFLAAIILAFWYLRNEEFEREQESVKRDSEVAQQQIRLRLIENQEQLVRIAREIVTRTIDRDQFLGQAASFGRERPEIDHLFWIGASRPKKAAH